MRIFVWKKLLRTERFSRNNEVTQLWCFQVCVWAPGGGLMNCSFRHFSTQYSDLEAVSWFLCVEVCVCVECVVAVLCGCICLPLLFAGVHLLASSSAPPPPSDSPCSGNKLPQPSPSSARPLSASPGKPAVPLLLSSVPPSLTLSVQKAAWSELKRPLVQFKLY